MAIYHFSAKIIGRSAGRSAVAAAAWQSSSLLYDERIGQWSRFTGKRLVEFSSVMLPRDALGSIVIAVGYGTRLR
jgi:hypothetical protein